MNTCCVPTAIAAPRCRGFTLLELLVVLVLIGIIVSFAVLSVGDGGRQERLKQEAERIYSLFTLAGEEAVLRSVELGVQLQADGYTFVAFDGETWQPIADDGMFRRHAFPETVELLLYLDGLEADLVPPRGEEENTPQLLFFSSGERTPFELLLSYRDDPPLAYRLQAPLLGSLQMERLEPAF